MFDKGTPWQGRCEKPSKQMKRADKAKKGALALGRSGAELCSDGPRKSNSGWSLIPCFIPISVSVSVSYQLSLAGQGKNDLPLLFTPAEAQVKRTTTTKKKVWACISFKVETPMENLVLNPNKANKTSLSSPPLQMASFQKHNVFCFHFA